MAFAPMGAMVDLGAWVAVNNALSFCITFSIVACLLPVLAVSVPVTDVCH